MKESDIGVSKISKKNHKKILGIISSVVILFLIGLGIGFYYINSKINKVQKVEVNKDNLSINKAQAEKAKHIKNIALFVIDAPKRKVGRSNAIMILTLDEEYKVIKLASIMRDSYVDIPGHGDDKITHAYAFGGS